MPRAGLTSERVTLAGAELADRIGFEEVTLSEVARGFEVRVASLYSHVASSHDLRTRIALLALTQTADRAADSMAGQAGKDALVALADTYRDYAHRHPGRYAALRYPLDAQAASESAGSRHFDLMLAVLRDYRLGTGDLTHAVRLLGSVVHGFVTLELAGSFDHREPDPQESWSRALDAIDQVLRSWEAAGAPAGGGS